MKNPPEYAISGTPIKTVNWLIAPIIRERLGQTGEQVKVWPTHRPPPITRDYPSNLHMHLSELLTQSDFDAAVYIAFVINDTPFGLRVAVVIAMASDGGARFASRQIILPVLIPAEDEIALFLTNYLDEQGAKLLLQQAIEALVHECIVPAQERRAA